MMTKFGTSAVPILSDLAEIVPELTACALDFDKLVEVVRYADKERAFVTANDPKGFDLITMNAKVARGLREAFCGEDWERDETDNQPGIKNAALKVRVIPCNFDENAGNRLRDPTNRTEKGAASRAKTRCNATAWLPGLPEPPEGSEEYVTLVLGSYSEAGEPLRAELSQPKDFSSGKYKKFAKRIILLDGTEDSTPLNGATLAPTEIIDIDVQRK